MRDGSTAIVQVVHGTFYLASGLWPLVHYQSFERVTGRRADRRLVKTVGAVITAVGASLLLAGFRRARQHARSPLELGASLATGLADLLYGGRGRISPMRFTEAAAQAALVAASLLRARR